MLCTDDCGAAAERDCRNGRCVRGFRNSSEGARERPREIESASGASTIH